MTEPMTEPMAETAEAPTPTPLEQLRRRWPGWRRLGEELWRGLWRDLLCLAAIAAATGHLVAQDGGRPLRSMLVVLALAAIAIVATFPTVKATPRWLQLLALAWVAGPLISLAFADVRAGWVRPVAAWAIAVPVAFATLHLLRRRWGATAIVAVGGGALALAWFNGMLIWWGGGTSRGEPAWMSLSWHNQSGTLMAVLGVAGLGLALTRTGWPRLIGVVATAAGLSAAWLSGSRGAVLTAGAAVLIVLVIAARRPVEGSLRRTGIVGAIAIALTVVAILGLLPLWADAGATMGDEAARPSGVPSQPITSRSQDAAGNLRARFGHWEAAVRMFAASPLTGTGPGSYQWSSRPVYPEDTNLTSSAHGEQLEALGELGLVGGGAALVVTVGLAWLVLAVIRRPGTHHLEVAAAGTVTLLASHAALDFDWDYPVLLALLAIGGAALVAARGLGPASSADAPDAQHDSAPDAQHDDTPDPQHAATPDAQHDDTPDPEPIPRPTAGTVLTSAVVGVALVLSAAGATGILLPLRGIMPWGLDARMAGAVAAAEHDDRPAVDERLNALATWNPGAPRLPDIQAITGHLLGDLSDEEFAAAIDPERSAHSDQVRAAAQVLLNGRPDLALGIVDDLRPVLDRRRAWGIRDHVVQAAEVALTAHHELDGCTAVAVAWPDTQDWLEDHNLDAAAFAQGPDEPTEADATWRECDLTTPRGD